MNGMPTTRFTDTVLNEEQLLADIVDAILDAEPQLCETDSEGEWMQILVNSCRRRKSSPSGLATSC